MRRMSRREFLERGMWFAAGAVAASIPGARAFAELAGKRRGPNGVLRLGVVGVKSRGLNHVQDYAKMKDVHVAALCDVDENVISAAAKAAEEGSGRAPSYMKDFRALMD